MTVLNSENQKAIEAVGAWLQSQALTATVLTPQALAALNAGRGAVGWRIEGLTAKPFSLTLDRAFPYSIPNFHVSGQPDGPHVNRSGKLCIAQDEVRTNTKDAVGVVSECLSTAANLINENAAGQHEEDFVNDFRPYWVRGASDKHGAWSLIDEGRRETRPLKVFLATSAAILGETDGSLERWLDNATGPTSRRFLDGAFVWIDELPKPTQYPNSVADVRRLLAPGQALIDDLLKRQVSPLLVAFRGPSGSGVAGGTIRMEPAQATRRPRSPRGAKGFRVASAQPVDIIACQWRAERVQELRLASASTRLPDALTPLRNKRVVIIGCGSLGAAVARLLLQSGVGAFLLLDPDELRWENIGRHELGAQRVLENKADALAAEMRRSFPQVQEVLSSGEAWGNYVARVGDAAFDSYDLVISATGDWNTESELNDFQRRAKATWPVLYAWAEREAMAAHALVLNSEGPCLRCGFDDLGSLACPITGWATDVGADGCAAPSSPYGAIDIGHAQNLTAKVAVDVLLARVSTPRYRIWTAPVQDLQAAGGHWHAKWKNAHGDPGEGGFQRFVDWPRKSGCICG